MESGKSPIPKTKASGQSFEEWVRGQTQVFRGQESVVRSNRLREGATPEYTGTAFSRQKEQAQKYGNLMLSKYMPEDKILMPKDVSPEILKNLRKEFNNLDVTDADSIPTERLITKVMDLAKQNNKDAADIAAFFKGMAEESEIRVLDKTKALTKSQLTDFYNQAVKGTLKLDITDNELKFLSQPIREELDRVGESI